MPVIDGRKSESEKFAGALRTYSIEALMGDGRALQAGTSHNLGQNFAKAFDIKFQARDKSLQHVWGTSWGVSTRLIGAVIMTHGDDSGLVLPPRVAPYQVVIVPIPRGNWQETVLPKAREIQAALSAAGVRVMLDDRDAYTPGWKFSEWELRGVPLRLEIGPKDIEKSQVVLARRDTREKMFVPMEGLAGRVSGLLEEIQRSLFERALRFREEHTTRTDSYEEFRAILVGRPGFVIAPWCGDEECEAQIKAETQATIRNLPLGRAALGRPLPAMREARDRHRLPRQGLLTRAAGPADEIPCRRPASARRSSSWPDAGTTGASGARSAGTCRAADPATSPDPSRRPPPPWRTPRPARRGRRHLRRRHRGQERGRQRPAGRLDGLPEIVQRHPAAAHGQGLVQRTAHGGPLGPAHPVGLGALGRTEMIHETPERRSAARTPTAPGRVRAPWPARQSSRTCRGRPGAAARPEPC